MPEISRFLGIVIRMYLEDHPPPHFHASYGEYKIAVEIKTGTFEGHFPNRALKFVLEWAEMHREELLEAWQQLERRELPARIPGLE